MDAHPSTQGYFFHYQEIVNDFLFLTIFTILQNVDFDDDEDDLNMEEEERKFLTIPQSRTSASPFVVAISSAAS